MRWPWTRSRRSAHRQAGTIILTGGIPADQVPPPQPAPDARSPGQIEEDFATFGAILALADELAARQPDALVQLVALIGRRLQGAYLTDVLARPDSDERVEEVGPSSLWFDDRLPLTSDGRQLDDLRVPIAGEHVVSLATGLVLPWPWASDRLARALCNIGPGRPWGPWRADENHSLLLWLPLGIAWVNGGNHSLAAGIARGEGRVAAEETWDMRAVYDHVACDGHRFTRRHDGTYLGPIHDPFAAALFEIGRRMLAHGVTAR
jgi:hypothetical protein